jgi:hypothetical protein
MAIVQISPTEKCYSWPGCHKHNTAAIREQMYPDPFERQLAAANAPSPLSKQEPVEVDTSLAALYGQIYMAEDSRDRAKLHEAEYRRMADDEDKRAERFNRASGYSKEYRERADHYRTEVEQAQGVIDGLYKEADVYEGEFRRRGGWTRAFLVAGPNGHVHRSMNCSTCNRDGKSTRFAWLPEYSGQAEAGIVEDAGERACTTCYPSAPVNVLARPTKIYSEEERRTIAERDKKRAEQEAKRNAKDAAKVTDENGEVVRYHQGSTTGRYWQEMNTERTASMALVELSVDRLVAVRRPEFARHDAERIAIDNADYENIVNALARKRGITREELEAEIGKKAEAKYKKDWGH